MPLKDQLTRTYMLSKTSDLQGRALNWAVAQHHPSCEGLQFDFIEDLMCGFSIDPESGGREVCIFIVDNFYNCIKARRKYKDAEWFNPAIDWQQTGQIISKEKILMDSYDEEKDEWLCRYAKKQNSPDGTMKYFEQKGSSPQVAALRCFLNCRAGDFIEVPERLITF